MNDGYVGTHLDLFSGIGGFALAARWTGWKTIGFSEIDPYCCKVLKRHWPDVPNYGDVRTVPTLRCDLITGGFPCQPFSVAGKRRGAADDRNLWSPMLSVIRNCRPSWVLAENVVNIANMVLHRCLNELENCGYRAKALDIPACAVGLQSLERHIWIVASHTHTRFQGSTEESVPVEQVPELFWREVRPGTSRIYGRPNLPEPKLLRSRKGLPHFVDRIRALANAINPQVAAVFLSAMRDLTNSSHVQT